MTTDAALVDLVVALLSPDPEADPPKPAPTSAGADVEAYRDWSLQTNSGPFTPRIAVDLPQNDMEGLGSGPSQFNTTTIIPIRFFLSAKASATPGRDGGEIRVRAAAVQLVAELKTTLINNPALMAEINRIRAVKIEMEGSTEQNGLHLVQGLMRLAVEYYQPPEDFYAEVFDDLDEVDVDAQFNDPAGAGLQLTIPLPT